MTTFKIEAALEGFFLMLNRAAQDPRLSADALAVLTYLHSLPPDWKIAIDGIQRHFSMKEKSASSVEVPQNYQAMGRDRTRQAINLLRELGYITRAKTSSTTYEYLVYAAADLNPNPESGVKVACPQKPVKVGSPDSDVKVGSPEVGSPDAITKQIDLQNKNLKKTHTEAREKNSSGFPLMTDDELDAVIEAFDSTVLSELKANGLIFPWRANHKKFNSASNFDPAFLAKVLEHLRTTPSGKEATLMNAAQWTAKREQSAAGLMEIRTISETNQSVQSHDPQIYLATPRKVDATIAPLDAASSLYNVIKAVGRQKVAPPLIERLRGEIKALEKNGYEPRPEWLDLIGENQDAT